MTLDQMFAECGGMRRASARAGHDHLGRSAPQCRDKLRDRLRQILCLPPHNIGRLAEFCRHLCLVLHGSRGGRSGGETRQLQGAIDSISCRGDETAPGRDRKPLLHGGREAAEQRQPGRAQRIQDARRRHRDGSRQDASAQPPPDRCATRARRRSGRASRGLAAAHRETQPTMACASEPNCSNTARRKGVHAMRPS